MLRIEFLLKEKKKYFHDSLWLHMYNYNYNQLQKYYVNWHIVFFFAK